MLHTLPELPYAKNSFGVYISEEGFNFHHGKHHATYVTNLNNLIKETEFADLSLDEIIVKSHKDGKTGIFNNSAQHFNHSFFWNCLKPNAGGAPTGKVGEMIKQKFGDFEKFKEEFSAKALTVFGSGWAFLALTKDNNLEILQMSNAGTPMMDGKKALLTIDVWEHAYYIDHRNARANFIQGFWNNVNWDFVNAQF